jgi:carbonic anhydrase
VAVAENVLTQIENLRTYPVIHSKLYRNKLHLHAWIYHIETGEVLEYDSIRHDFVPPDENAMLEASPVQCFLSLPEDVEELVPGYRRSPSQEQSTESVAQNDRDPNMPWLSAEQVARIHHGSNGSR